MWRFSGLRCPLLRVAIFHDVIGNRLQPACIVCFSGRLILSIASQSLVPQRGHTFQGAYGTCSTTIRPRTISKVLRSRAIWQPFSWHNEVRDMTASLLTEVCHGVSTEPHLQPLTGEAMPHRSANVEDGARLDVAVQFFWGRQI